MEKLLEKFRVKLKSVETNFVRSTMGEINWNARLIGIKGARGVGKTTLLLQYIKLHLVSELDKVLYVSLDNMWFSENSLYDLGDIFTKHGGKYLFLDEVHKYSNWSTDIKNLYDDYPDLKIVFTGSSLLEILNARADLSRRAVVYHLQGLSYREYLNIELGADFQTYTLTELLNNHLNISEKITTEIKPLMYFKEYLQSGYYPYYREESDLYYLRLNEVINMILEIELPITRNVDISYVHKLKQLLFIIAQSAPFIPNISKLSERIKINRQTLLSYLSFLGESKLINLIYKDAHGISLLQKPSKIYLENTNLMYALSEKVPNQGNIRETFFLNQIAKKHLVELAPKGDFIVDKNMIFEIGGKSKGIKQIKGIENSYIVADDIEYGFGNRIPLWLFGFLY
jgi:hypothetical protein